MLRDLLTGKTLTALAAVAGLCVVLAESASTLVYPAAPRTNQVDDYHGRQIADPYRTLEDPDNAATRAWIEAEVKLTDQWLAAIPQRDPIRRRLTQLFDYERYPAAMLANFSRGFIWGYAGAFSAGSHYFLMRNSGLQNQAVLYTVDAEGNQPKVLLDPNTFRSDGTAALCGLSPSHGGGLLAFGTAQAGSDWCEWRIRNVDSGQDLPEVLQWTKDAAPNWTPDNRAFYYVRYPKPPEGKALTAINRNAQVMLHRVGEAAGRDRLVYEDPAHADSGFGPVLTADARWLIVHMDLPQDSSRNMLYFEDLSAASPRMASLTPDPKDLYDYIGSQGSHVYLRTTDGAPKGRIIAIDLSRPGREHWEEVVAEQPDSLDHATLASGRLLLSYLHNAHARAVIYSLTAKTTGDVAFDGIGAANWSPAQPDSNELFYSFVTFTSPAALYRLDLRTGRSTLLRSSKLSFDAGQYQTDQVLYPSKDGTQVSTCYDPGTSRLPIQTQYDPPVMRIVVPDQATSGSLSLPTLAMFSCDIDPNTGSGYSYSIDWGDGSAPSGGTPTVGSPLAGSSLYVGSFGGSHTYTDPGVYYVLATVTAPGTGGSSTATMQVTVDSTASLLTTSLPDASVNAGETYTLPNIAFTGLGIHTATVNWGDGTTDNATVVEPYMDDTLMATVPGSLTDSHIYSTSGSYPVTVTLTDDSGNTLPRSPPR